MIPSAFLQDLLSCIDITEVVGRYLQLKKSGSNFVGLCPFHHEKSPSFTVSPSKQFYHCFGCGAHGTAISFLMAQAGLTFPDAVNELAQSVGLKVPQQARANESKKKQASPPPHQPPDIPLRNQRESSTKSNKNDLSSVSESKALGAAFEPRDSTYPQTDNFDTSCGTAASSLTEILQQACNYYRTQLRSATHAVAYLKQRGLTGEIAARFGIGYASRDWQNLKSAFTDYQDDALVNAGLVIRSNKIDSAGQPRRHDRFRDRIMFPIRNGRGKVVGFGGRVIDAREPKYLNSPETPLFNKGSELYGLFEARVAIREKRYVLVVEGYLDVIALAQLGFPNTVATLGTACTSSHLRQIFRQTDTLIFSFDGDDAGRRAARRALESCLPYAADNRTIRFLFLPIEHDPDTYIRAHGAQVFAHAVENALPLSQWLLNEILSNKSLDQPEGCAKALFDAKPLVQALPQGALRAQILQRLADQMKLPVAEIQSLCECEASNKSRAVARIRTSTRRSEGAPRVTAHERRALRNLIAYPRIVQTLDEKEMQTLREIASYRELFHEVLMHAQALGERADFKMLSDLLRNSPNSAAYEEIFREILIYDENVRDLLLDQPESDADRQRCVQQEGSIGEELKAAVASLQDNARRKRCEYLSNQPKLSQEESAELIRLQRQTVEFKKRISNSCT